MSSITSKNIHTRNWSVSSTGGTSGETLVFKRSNQSRDFDWAAAFRAWRWGGYQIGDRYLDLWSHPKTHINRKGVINKLSDRLRQRLIINTYDIDRVKLRNCVPIIKKFKPKFLRGYSSALFILSKVVNPEEIQPEGVFTTAENLTQNMRRSIEETFNCMVFDGYSGEGGAHANECDRHEGYHIHSEGVIMEFIKEGRKVSSGETGEIVVTDLNNYKMPFIRYRIGDMGIPFHEACSCKRTLPLISELQGRVSDIIVTPTGKIVTRPSFFGSSNVMKITGLDEYQVIQEKIDKVTILVITNQEYTKQCEALIMGMAEDILGKEVDIKLKHTNKIEVAPSGKRKVIVSKLNILSI